MSFFYRPYVSKADRQKSARTEAKSLRKQGVDISPIEIEGRTISKSVWGKAWCDFLESHADYENRLPKGRTYVRNGSVFHLAAHENIVEAKVAGSEVYSVSIEFTPLPKEHHGALQEKCKSTISSLGDLLAGRVPPDVMMLVCEKKTGLFPAPGHMKFRCSCPDWASMCKHVAAVLYGVGARLDANPELLFMLRGVDHRTLVPDAATTARRNAVSAIDDADLADVFGVDIAPVQSKNSKQKLPLKEAPKTLKPEPAKKKNETRTATKSRSVQPKIKNTAVKAGLRRR